MPLVKVSKKQIIDAALNIIRKNGFDKLNARSLSSELKCSTQPIFSNYATMDELKDVLIEEVKKIQADYIEKGISLSDHSFKGSGLGYIEFAKKEKNLYKFLFSNKRDATVDDEENSLKGLVKMLSKTLNISEKSAFDMQIEMWAVVHGLSSMIAYSFMNFTDKQIDSILTNTFNGLLYVHKGEKE